MKTETNKKNGLGMFILFLMMAATAICQGRIITVDDNAPADFNNIQAAINAFAEGDSILVADGNYTGTGNRDIINSTDPCIKNLIIRSANGPEKCIINCAGTSRKPYGGFAFYAVNKDLNIIIDGLTITNGWATGRWINGNKFYWKSGGAIYCDANTANLEIINCVFKNNWTYNDGGAIYLYRGNFKIRDCSFIGNSASLFNIPNWKNRGGGIYCEKGSISQSLIIERSMFNGNTAGEGGGIFNRCVDRPVYKNCTFTGNKGWYSSGGICDYNTSNPTFENCTFSGNTTVDYEGGGGGILGSLQDKPVYRNCTFNDNNSNGDGGGIYDFGSNKPVFENCIFNNNICFESGGGIYSDSNEAVFENCIFTGNKATADKVGYGGAVFAKKPSTFKNCEFRENISRDQALVGQGTLINCVFTKNAGGGAYFAGNFVNCIFKENSSIGYGSGGGGVDTSASRYIYGIPVPSISKFTNCVFIKNYAKFSGGGVACKQYGSVKFNVIFENCQFIENAAGSSGGGIYSDISKSTIVRDCVFIGNTSNNGGGAYLGLESYPLVQNCTFVGNSAVKLGGGIYSYDWFSRIISNSILWNNVDQNGIGVYSQIYSLYKLYYIKINYCCIQGWTDDLPGEGHIENINLDPLFVDPCNPDPNLRNYHLQVNSPCINTGDPNYVAEVNETDLDGNPRVMYGRVDMGAYEFLNKIPVANAGPDQTVYAYIDGIADVNLDGSDSNDSDGQPLTYTWTWTTDGNTYEANGINPTIELPVGIHTIELIVNDGIDDSLPDYVDVNVIAPVKVSLVMMPQAINLASQGNWIRADIILPAGFGIEDVDANVSLVVEPVGTKSKSMNIAINDMGLVCITALFDRGELCGSLNNGSMELSVVGRFKSGQYFYGSDVIKVIGKK